MVKKGGLVQAVPLTPHGAAQIVKAYARRVGLDPAAYSGHSLRSGFLTSAAEAGASIFKMMESQPAQEHGHVARLRAAC